MTPKPSVFIGSSTLGLDIAKAIKQSLETGDDSVRARLWSERGMFRPGCYPLKRLLRITDKFDFAVFVYRGDDVVFTGGDARAKRTAAQGTIFRTAPRDNIVFEHGLFAKALGIKRTFLTYSEDDQAKIPTDCQGITYVPFKGKNPSKACKTIKKQIRKLGFRTEAMGRLMVALPTRHFSGGREQEVEVLKPVASGTKPNYISHDLLHRGTMTLRRQIKRCRPELHPRLIVGVNATGLMIALHLDGVLETHGARCVGSITSTPKDGEKRVFCGDHLPPADIAFPPNLSRGPVLVVDSELKSGDSLNTVEAFLKQKYGEEDHEVNVYTAVLCLCETDFDKLWKLPTPIAIERTSRVSSGESVAPLGTRCESREDWSQRRRFPDFVAFICRGGVEIYTGQR